MPRYYLLFIIFILFSSSFLFFSKDTFAAELCAPGVHNPGTNFSEEGSEDACPSDTICYTTIGSIYRCYIPEGSTPSITDPTAGFSRAESNDSCTGLNKISFSPNPVEAKKQFTVNGRLENCPDIAAQAIFIDLENTEHSEERRGVRDVRTDSEGNFSLDKFVIDTPGDWKLKFRYNLRDRIIDSPQAIITVTESSKKEYTCGDQVENDASICPAECPNTRVGDVYKCGDSKSNPELEDLCKAQGNINININVNSLPSCNKLSGMVPARKCSNDTNSYICPDPTLIMCRGENSLIACGAKEIDPARGGGIPCDPKTGKIYETPILKSVPGQVVERPGSVPTGDGKPPGQTVSRPGAIQNSQVNPPGQGVARPGTPEDQRSATDKYRDELKNLPKGVMTAIGCVPTEPKMFVEGILKYGSFAAGGIAFLIMIIASLQLITAEGNPEVIKGAQEKFYSAIIGLLLIIFAVLLMQVIGVDILGLPGFGPTKP